MDIEVQRVFWYITVQWHLLLLTVDALSGAQVAAQMGILCCGCGMHTYPKTKRE